MTRRRLARLLLGSLAAGCAPRPAPADQPPTSRTTTAGLANTATPVPLSPPSAPPTPSAEPGAAPATGPSPPERRVQPVQAGIDVLLREHPDLLKGRHLGLVTNHTGIDRQGQSTIDLLHAGQDWHLVALFSPEHGIRGAAEAGERVDSATDARTGLPIHSLYGETTRPTPEMLRGVDAVVFDIQDVGARVYTYISTLLEVLHAGAAHAVSVVVLDRPNPINGTDIEGNVLDARFASFVGPAPIAMRYGMTIGELGRLFNAELQVGADLTVVPLRGWRRVNWYDQTGLQWVDPSPNMRSLAAATVYPGTVLFEGTNLSEGRGTDRPFEWLGAPWIDGTAWADRLNRLDLPGVRFQPASRTPTSSKFAGRDCQGALVEIVDRARVRPMELGLTMLATARELAPQHVQLSKETFDRLAGTDQVRRAIEAGRPVAEIVVGWQPDLEQFRAVRARYLLY